MGEPRRLATYDILRLGATVAVVCIHVAFVSQQFLGNTDTWLSPVERILNLFAVPIFFFISGALVWAKYDLAGVRPWARFIVRRIRTVLLPYLGWSLFYWFAVGGVAFGAWAWWELFVTGDARYHLYFIPILMVFYLMTPLAKRLLDVSPLLLVVLAFSLDFGITAVVAGGETPDTRGFVTLAVRSSLFVPYIALGAVYGSRRAVRSAAAKAYPFLLAVAAVAVIWIPPGVDGAALRTWTSLSVGIGLFGLAGISSKVGASTSLARRAAVLAPETYLVYLAHPVLLGLAEWIVPQIGFEVNWANPLVYVLNSVFIIVVSFGGAIWWHRIRHDLSDRRSRRSAHRGDGVERN